MEPKKFTEFCNFGPLSNIVVGECSCFGSSGLTLTNSRFTIGVQCINNDICCTSNSEKAKLSNIPVLDYFEYTDLT